MLGQVFLTLLVGIYYCFLSSKSGCSKTEKGEISRGEVKASYDPTIIDSSIRPLEDEEIFRVHLHCELFFEKADEGLLRMVSLKQNWEELTTDPKCTTAFVKKCGMLSASHLQELIEDLTEGSEQNFQTSVNRLSKLCEIGCIQDFYRWDIIELKQAPILAASCPLKELRHWVNLEPPVLQFMMEIQKTFSDLPVPISGAQEGIKKILLDQYFMSGRTDGWLAFSDGLFSFISKEQYDFVAKIASAFCKLGELLIDDIRRVIWGFRTEKFILYILAANYPAEQKVLDIIDAVIAARKAVASQSKAIIAKKLLSGFSRNCWNFIEAKLSDWRPEYIISLREQETLLQKTIAESGISEEGTSLLQLQELLQNAQYEKSADESTSCRESQENLIASAMFEYYSSYPFTAGEITQQQNLWERIFDKALKELEFYVELKQNQMSYFYIPTIAFIMCLNLLNHRLPGAFESLGKVQRVIEEDASTHTSILRELYEMQGLEPCVFALIKNRKQLREFGLVSHGQHSEGNITEPLLDLTRSILKPKQTEDDPDFFLEEIEFLAKKTEEAVMNPSALGQLVKRTLKVRFNTGTDGGALCRHWIEQMLSLIGDKRREITVSHSIEDGFVRKFGLMVHPDVGFFAGVMFGKAIQNRVTLPFVIDPGFLNLAADPSAEKIDVYYCQTYSKEWKEFFDIYLMGANREHFEAYWQDSAISKLETLQMTTLYADTNLIKASAADRLQVVAFEQLQNLYEQYLAKAKYQFANFVARFVEGFSKIVHIDKFKYLLKPNLFYRTLNKQKLTAAILLEVVKFNELGKELVDSLVPGKKISARAVFESYLNSLGSLQLEKLVAIWCGASGLDIDLGDVRPVTVQFVNPAAEKERFNVGSFISPSPLEPALRKKHSLRKPAKRKAVKSLADAEREMEEGMFSSGIEYKDGESKDYESDNEEQDEEPVMVDYKTILVSAARLQHNLMQEATEFLDPFNSGMFHQGPLYPTRISSCAKCIYPPLISAAEMIASLVVCTNLPNGVFFDEVSTV